MAVNPKKSSLLFKIVLIGFVICAGYMGKVVFFPQAIPNNQYQLIINKKQSLTELSTMLQRRGIIENRRIFNLVLRILHKDRKVTAGLYLLKGPISTWGLIKRITNGKPDAISVTLLDGWTFAQIRNYLNGLKDIQHLSLTMTDTDIKNMLKIDYPNLEGVFFPETYFIAPGQSDLEVLQIAYRLMQVKLTDLYLKRNASADYTSPYQMLIMASLIQKESANVEDMYLISTVFNNRLRIKMKLQDDPAVFYGLNGKKSVIRRPDFQIDTAYNTYLHAGLPPTPITTPSYNALSAASQPLNRPDLLYFIAVGHGKTRFSTTYSQHLSIENGQSKNPEPKAATKPARSSLIVRVRKRVKAILTQKSNGE